MEVHLEFVVRLVLLSNFILLTFIMRLLTLSRITAVLNICSAGFLRDGVALSNIDVFLRDTLMTVRVLRLL